MNKAFIFANLLILTLLACKQDPKNAGENGAPGHMQPGDHANPTLLAGHWIAMDFCARANQYGSVLQAMNNSHLPYAYALSFNPARPDSVLLTSAIETWTLPIRYKVDTLEILNARPGKSIFLIYHSNMDKDITMIDPTGERVRMDRFVKSKADAPEGYTAFATALNNNILGGTFTPIGKAATEKTVRFTAPGYIEGIKGFDRYLICAGGDCMVAGQDVDVVTFYNPKHESKYFGYKYNGQNDTLTLFNLINTNPAEKGAYKVGTPAYKFARKVAR